MIAQNFLITAGFFYIRYKERNVSFLLRASALMSLYSLYAVSIVLIARDGE